MLTKEIKSKIKSVSNIQKITKTMEMVSVSKMRRSTERANASKAYAEKSLSILKNLSSEKSIEHPFLSEKKNADKTVLIIVSSNKGLCGGFNVNINKKIKKFLEVKDADSIKTICIGKQAEKIARRNQLDVIASFTNLGDIATTEEVLSISKVVMKEFEKNDTKKVLIVFTNYVKMLDYHPVIQQILPINQDSIEKIEGNILNSNLKQQKSPRKIYTVEPNSESVLNEVLPGLIVSLIYQALLESSASEHSSRMVAMKGATDNAGNLLESLKLSYNKARQEAITKEISEIAAGGEATSNS